MILISWGKCALGYKTGHEFGNPAAPQFKSFGFGFFQIIKFKENAGSRFVKLGWAIYQDTHNSKEYITEVRQAKLKAEKKANDYYRKMYSNKLEELETRNNDLSEKLTKLDYENHILKQAVQIKNGEEVKRTFSKCF